METWDPDTFVDKLMMEYDDTFISLPDIEAEPHLLISKVRKHYMEYMIKLLSNNYETNQKLINKNIYLPSAIWRCAKAIEMKAAQTCMVVQLYRKNIVAAVKEIKNDTKKGRLNRKLFDCLQKPARNDKKVQTKQSRMNDCNCQCTSNQIKRRRKSSDTNKHDVNSFQITSTSDSLKTFQEIYKIPVAINLNSVTPQQVFVQGSLQTQPSSNCQIIEKPKAQTQISVESRTSESDELLMQLEKLFQGDPNDDDLFEGTLCETVDSTTFEDHTRKDNEGPASQNSNLQDNVIEAHAAQIKSLDERLATLAGLLVNNNDSATNQQETENTKSKRDGVSKWICEEYFLKTKLYELLYQIGETNRKELARIKELFIDLFGHDSDDDEGVVSPLDETPEFMMSCKERIAPWVVKLLTPYYFKGRIRGRSLFKALSKHLIRLIYQCSRYPQEYEVQSFVTDFLANHKMIRCEADFKEFRIENI
ncbi:hypothetical protein K1T71_012220 [Dendrolimus kikuchii]|uniref:Uncharacterized protein n=1 Tax=Dendrolimus kikuchii TaxID=765133 RepID=A0ACC1CKZ4_9NEOP|nr:hypothetical protein K1T71_012220 [Dendrolimus kikuchii]